MYEIPHAKTRNERVDAVVVDEESGGKILRGDGALEHYLAHMRSKEQQKDILYLINGYSDGSHGNKTRLPYFTNVQVEPILVQIDKLYLMLEENGDTDTYKKERVHLLVDSPEDSITPIYSPRPLTTPSYSPGASTPPSYSSGPSRNAECANCKLLIGKLQVLEARLEMSVDEDFWVAGVINKLCEGVAAANEETCYFIQELDVVPGWVVGTQKTPEFLKKTQKKDDERLRQLEAQARETEARAREKCIFIKKLKGNQPF
ncbi:hypothetical protein Tco_1266027 [Tanacetum coccineum]